MYIYIYIFYLKKKQDVAILLIERKPNYNYIEKMSTCFASDNPVMSIIARLYIYMFKFFEDFIY